MPFGNLTLLTLPWSEMQAANSAPLIPLLKLEKQFALAARASTRWWRAPASDGPTATTRTAATASAPAPRMDRERRGRDTSMVLHLRTADGTERRLRAPLTSGRLCGFGEPARRP